MGPLGIGIGIHIGLGPRPSGGTPPIPSTAGQPIGLLLLLTKAS